MGNPAVTIRRLTKVYGQGRTAVKALDDIDLAIEHGAFVAVMGPSGSGKSTLLNLIGALDRPTTGEVYLDDVEVTGQPEAQLFRIRREQLGFVFQAFHLSPTLSALDNVLLPSLPVGINRARRRRAEELLERMGLGNRLKRRPGELSTGEKQRVALARALILDPGLLLLDEPTGNLDTQTGAEVIRLLEQLNRELGKTFILVTHDARVAHRCHRIIFLRDGRLCTAAESGLDEVA
jgi:putative ABC transport system ATP-binding protein